ncbi:hypothetical protein MAJ_07429, partial [Metarhizium majus ARSEF 297]
MEINEEVDDRFYPFVYDAVYPFLFCRLCKYAVLAPSTSDHLKDMHKDLPNRQRKVVRMATAQLQNMYVRQEEVDQFRLPSPSDAAIPYLRQPETDGIRCGECGWITRSTQRKRAHSRETHQGSGRLRWMSNVRCQQLFAKGPRSGWFEVERQEDVFSSEGTVWVHENDASYVGVTEDVTDVTDVIDLATPTRTRSGSGGLERRIESYIDSGQTGADSARKVDASWFAVAHSGVGCVLCAVRGFQLRCVDGVAGGAPGGGVSEARRSDAAAACGRCGLGNDWRADGRLQDERLLCAARMVGLWEQMKSIGASFGGGFDARRLATACTWLETGGKGSDDSRTVEQHKYETPRAKTVVTQNGQITPADEREDKADLIVEEEISVDDMEAIMSSISGYEPVGSVYKRRADSDLASSPAAKSRRTEAKASYEAQVPSLFNGAMVAQVQRTGEGMRHEGMSQHELDAYEKWRGQYRSRDSRGEAAERRWKMDGKCARGGAMPREGLNDMELGHATRQGDTDQGAGEERGERRGGRLAGELGMLEVRVAGMAVRQL